MNLHIVSFDIPLPADYGGVIDVFHKLPALAEKGVKIFLHCFEYGRSPSEDLLKYCQNVYYYPRSRPIKLFFSNLPFIVNTRNSRVLLENLTSLNAPVLFEGLHSCYFLNHPALQNRVKLVRTTNIEHRYYFNLYQSETNLLKKIYFYTEGKKLEKFEAILNNASCILPISRHDYSYFSKKYQDRKVIYLPAFHSIEKTDIPGGTGKHILYHGNLAVPENNEAVLFLIENVFSKINLPVVIAGKKPGRDIRTKAAAYRNINLIPDPSADQLHRLIQDAQINLLYAFHAAGMKIKLLHALFNGRHCIANSTMVNSTGLNSACNLADSPEEIISSLNNLYGKEISEEQMLVRKEIFESEFNNSRNAARLVNLIEENFVH